MDGKESHDLVDNKDGSELILATQCTMLRSQVNEGHAPKLASGNRGGHYDGSREDSPLGVDQRSYVDCPCRAHVSVSVSPREFIAGNIADGTQGIFSS